MMIHILKDFIQSNLQSVQSVQSVSNSYGEISNCSTVCINIKLWRPKKVAGKKKCKVFPFLPELNVLIMTLISTLRAEHKNRLRMTI